MSDYDRTAACITKDPTDIWGLAFFPNMEPHISNEQDGPAFGGCAAAEVTFCNLEVVKDVVRELGSNLKACMEIGVDRESNPMSMSRILINERPAGSFYLGVDVDDKSRLDNPDANTWTLISNSHDQEKVRGFLSSKGITKLDLLFIDGYHSVNTTVNDWRYADMLSDHGIVIVHDTNRHPGDVAICEAVDKTMFTVTRHCDLDNGIAVIRRIKPAT